MPTYEYQCSSCNKMYEFKQKITEEPLTLCPDCKKETLKRVLSKNVNFQFKGSGFYITDYPNNPAPKEASKETPKDAPQDTPKDPPKSCGNSCGCAQ
jgi:putative FmdB family regulatory protein